MPTSPSAESADDAGSSYKQRRGRSTTALPEDYQVVARTANVNVIYGEIRSRREHCAPRLPIVSHLDVVSIQLLDSVGSQSLV